MPFTEKRLAGPTQLTTSAVAIYTVPANRTTIVKQLVATNTSASAATFTLYIGTATAANAVFNATSVAANDSLVINLSQVLATGEVLRALASANTAINLTISGVENDGPLTPTATYIADNAITTAKLADSSVTTAKIAEGAVVTADIANNAITQAKLDTAVPLSGFRNAIINGGFSVNQRAFTSTTTNGQYGFDRWRLGATDGTVTYSTQTFTLGNQISGQEPTNFARIVTTGQTSSTAEASLIQPIESVRTFAGETVTISFWAKANTGTPKVAIEWQQRFGSGGSPSSIVFTYGGQVTISTSWARYSVTFAVPSISGKTIGTDANSSSCWMHLFVSAGTGLNSRTGSLGIQTNTFDIWGVQVEAGSAATPFEQRPIGVELQLCQRYCAKWGGQSTYGYDIAGMGWAASATGAGIVVRHPVPFRSMANSISFSGVRLTDFNNPYTITAMSINAYISNQISSQLDIGTSGLTAYRPCDLQVGNGSLSNYLILAAEL